MIGMTPNLFRGNFIDLPKTPGMERPIGENLREIKYKTTCML